MKHVKSLVATLSLATLMSTSAMAATVEVDAVGTAFSPIVVFVKPGDKVTFNNMAGHISTTEFESKGKVVEYMPKGAKGWTSQMGENITTPALKEGVYFYKCTPHWGMGMGGSIVVGKPTNFQAIKDSKPHGALHRLVHLTEKALKAKGME